ncbi:MAG: hypothetical protein LBI40_02055 [Treponema sp.]|nr:hypothetical protein [Treponema sp.]
MSISNTSSPNHQQTPPNSPSSLRCQPPTIPLMSDTRLRRLTSPAAALTATPVNEQAVGEMIPADLHLQYYERRI